MSTLPALPALGVEHQSESPLLQAPSTGTNAAVGFPRAGGDMSYVDEPFDPRPISEPRRRMPGVLDLDVENNQLNMVNFTAVVNRTANVAVPNQGLEV